MKQKSGFMGTYFDRDSVLRLEVWTRITAWIILVSYTVDAGYNAFQNMYAALASGYPVDVYFIILTLSRIFQGGMIFVILQVAAKMLLILLDIEDNTRRAARENPSKN